MRDAPQLLVKDRQQLRGNATYIRRRTARVQSLERLQRQWFFFDHLPILGNSHRYGAEILGADPRWRDRHLIQVLNRHVLRSPNIPVSAFCIHCGAALNPDTAFCTGCGAAVPAATQPARKPRRWPWILALLLIFALGFWLGRRQAPKCPQCPAAPVTGTGGG